MHLAIYWKHSSKEKFKKWFKTKSERHFISLQLILDRSDLFNRSHPIVYNINKVFNYVLPQHQYIIINTLILATCFGLYQPSSGLCLLYGGTFSVHIQYEIPWCLYKIITVIKVYNFKFQIYRSGCFLQDICRYCYQSDGTLIVKIMSTYIHIELIWNLCQTYIQLRPC